MFLLLLSYSVYHPLTHHIIFHHHGVHEPHYWEPQHQRKSNNPQLKIVPIEYIFLSCLSNI